MRCSDAASILLKGCALTKGQLIRIASSGHYHHPMNAGFLSPNKDSASAKQPRAPCILIVDSNLTELQATGRMIEMCGYKTIQRFEHAVALRTFQRTPDSYDVAVIDFSKSVKAARHLVREIRRLNTSMALIFYVDSPKSITRDELRQLDALCIVKPAPTLQFAGTLMTLLAQSQCPPNRPASLLPIDESTETDSLTALHAEG